MIFNVSGDRPEFFGAIQLRHDFLVGSHSSIELNHVCLINMAMEGSCWKVSLCIPIGPSMLVTSLCGYVLSILHTVILCFVNHKYPGVGSLSPTTLSCNQKNLLEPHEKGQPEIESMESLAAKCELYVNNLDESCTCVLNDCHTNLFV